MAISDLLTAAALGLLEGATEYIPVSSTAHLLLAGKMLGFTTSGKTFEVLIQLGAILALISVYAKRIIGLLIALPHDRQVQRFTIGVALAFLPAAFIGIMMYTLIKEFIFEALWLISLNLILGGVVLLVLDRLSFKVKYDNVLNYPLSLCLKIGLFQTLALIPGTSRSGATIAGALICGADKKSATDFSFFLAIPTMTGAFSYDLFKNYNLLTANDGILIAIGFMFAFLSGMVVVGKLVDFVGKHGFALFAYWRIIVGLLSIFWLTWPDLIGYIF